MHLKPRAHVDYCNGYPATKPLFAALKDALGEYELSKGTIRFPLSKRVPADLIKRIAKFRAQEVAQRKTIKAVAPKKKR